MDENIRQRALDIAAYMLKSRATVRQAAKAFGLSKSSVHKDMSERLPEIDQSLGAEVAALLRYNKAVRHLRGGESTRRLYKSASGR